MSLRAALAALAVGLVATPALAAPVVVRDEVDVSPPAGVAVTRVTIDNRYGDVTVVGHDKDQVAIEATKRAPDAEALERVKVQLVPDPAGGVLVTGVLKAGTESRPLPAGSVRIDLVVKVPRGAHVEARLWRGRAAIRAVDGGAEVAVDHGDVELAAVSGDISTETSFGDQRLEDVFGAIEARAVEGSVALARVRGARLAASVYKGRISGQGIRVRDLAVELGRGDVELELEPMLGGHYVVAAWRGDVAIRVGGKAAVTVTARSRGRIDLPRRLVRARAGRAGELVGYLGSGASPAVLDLSSRAGSITLAEF